MLENGRGLIKALENWAKRVTTDYKDVNVRDLSTSFRDGLAFCAIIHYYRPDLIDFDSLSRENIFQNNSLAFNVAEKQLGVPALLDAEDMVKCAHPDRLSIITYLSQLRNCFENQNKVNKKPELKRIQNNSFGPPAKVPVVELSLKRHEVCQVCKHRVFILERLIVDGKLYHTACFRCHKCNSLLNPGAYVESDTPGIYECSVCLRDETSESTDSSVETYEQPKRYEFSNNLSQATKPIVKPEREFSSKEAVSFAKSNLSENNSKFEKSSPLYSLRKFDTHTEELKNDEKIVSEIKISVKDKINVFEKNQVNEKPSLPSSLPPVVTPVPKIRHSLISKNNNGSENSNIADTLSSMSAKSSEKNCKESEKESPSTKNSLSDNGLVLEKSSLDENKCNINCEKDANVKKNEVNVDSVANSNSSLFKVPNSGSVISSNKMKYSDSESSVLSFRSGSESPKVSKDIFKSSLQPLKLSLLSPSRKEGFSSPVTPSESEKTFEIPQITSSYSVSSISKMNHSVENKERHSNKNIEFENQSKVPRRSSLESSCETANKDDDNKSLLRTNSNTFHRVHSSHELSYHSGTDVTKTGIKPYIPIYKRLYSTPSLTSNIVANANSDISVIKQEDKDLNSSSSFSLPSEVNRLHEICNTEVIEDLGVPPCVPNADDEKSIESKEEEKEYPDDLNPFGDEENDTNVEYPDDLNPFGEDEEEVNCSVVSVDDYDESKNPFASDEDTNDTPVYLPKPCNSEIKSPQFQDSICSNMSSPSGSLKGTLKKRPAPRPPKASDIFPRDSADSGTDTSFTSTKVSPSISKKSFQTSSPKVRKNKPAPPPPPSPSLSVQDTAASVKMIKETDNMKLKSSMTEDKQLTKQYKKKKRPAPPVPIPVRRDMKKIPLREIIQEMKEIEEKQREFEKQGREIELLIRDRDKDEEPSIEEEELIMQLFELVNQKNALFRRQAELMYIKRSQRLEEQQCHIEQEIRQLMEKPESEKTEDDKQKEEDLMLELLDIVDQRNSIIDSIEMDRRRELEEDHSVQEQLEIKNGDLTITAEIKQKTGKNKKNKVKKEKKKHVEEESGKGTLKKKKNLLFSKRS